MKNPMVGRRVRLIQVSDPWTKLRQGSLGTIAFVDALGTLHVNWDCGSTLGLIPDEDIYEVLK